jgi:hypothetical protein
VSNSQTPKKTKTRAAKIAGIISTVMWIAGFLIMPVLPKGSAWMWTSDLLLLLGFFPLLFVWKPGWPWVIFGLLNVGIGFILLIGFYIPDKAQHFNKEQMVMLDHLAVYHSPFTWMVVGIIATVYGVIRMIKNLVKFILKKRTESLETPA